MQADSPAAKSDAAFKVDGGVRERVVAAEANAEDAYDEDVVIIIDNGSGVCKAGFSCDEYPKVCFPEIVGKPRSTWKASLNKPVYCGDQVEPIRSKLSVGYPLENGIIENFDAMELLWEHTFFEALNVNPSNHPVLLTEPPYNPKPNREEIVEIMFEVFGVPSLNISIQGVLALLGQGRTTGIVLDSGEGVTHTIPIYDGYGLPHCINRLDLAGRDLNVLLAKLLAQEGTCMTTTTDQHHCRLIKEQHCYVALDPTAEFADSVSYKLEAGREISLTDERWKCPEALFSPAMMGVEGYGVAGLVWESIEKCDIDLRRKLLSNVVLSGGSTMFPGFAGRLTKDLKARAPPSAASSVKVITSENQKFAVWKGGQVFASLRTTQEDQWMTKFDYEEYGVSLIHEKIAVKN